MSEPIIQKLNEMQARCDAATEGPWRAALLDGVDLEDGSSSYRGGIYPGQLPGPAPVFLINCIDARDAEFIAMSRTSLPKTIDALEAVLEVVRLHRREPAADGSVDEYDYAGALADEIEQAIEEALGVES